jgi:CheY-like chemotaxis protein
MAKVLLVEDDNNLREIYEARLMAEGYTINSAKDGEEALVVAKAEKPDLIISDVMMPKISGFEMLDILRNTQGLKETKVIMLTALGQADDRTRADSLGADRYLVKSQVTLEDIVKAAHELLEGDAAAAPAAADTTPPAPEAAATVPATSEPAPAAAPTASATVPAPEEPATPPQIAVSEPPVAPAADAATSAPAPVVATPTPSLVPPAPADPAPAADEPVSSTASTAATTSEPASTASDAPVATEPAEEAPPAIELPDSTAEEAPTATETPAGESSDAAASPELPATESAAEEQATVNNQIEEFIKNNAVEVPAEEHTSEPPNATTDKVMQESVDTLIASAEHEAAPASTPATVNPPSEAEAETPATPPATTAAQREEAETSDGVTIAHKKLIPRPESGEKPNLNELLAREEAKKIIIGDSASEGNTVVQNDTPAAPAEEPVVPPAAPLPGNTFSPTNGTAPKADEETDPNSIAL